jgi:hypothetical protein
MEVISTNNNVNQSQENLEVRSRMDGCELWSSQTP